MDADSTRELQENTEQEKPHKIRRVLLAPLTALNRALTALLKKALGNGYADVTEDDVMDMVDALVNDDDENAIEQDSAQMISNIFEFSSLTAGDVMTHRTSIVGVDIRTITLDDLIYLALDMGFSRIPVYEGTIDKILGMIIVKDLLCLIGKPELSDFDIHDFLRDVIFIPEACSCLDTFRSLTSMKSGMAVVVDEYGGTAGIVTLEDIIEAVMGNIQDEYDNEKSEIVKIGEEQYEVLGETDPEKVLELFGVTLPEGHEYETIAGFVTDKLGYIPEGDELMPPTVDYEGVRLIVVLVEDRTIIKIQVQRAPQTEPAEEENNADK